MLFQLSIHTMSQVDNEESGADSFSGVFDGTSPVLSMTSTCSEGNQPR